MCVWVVLVNVRVCAFVHVCVPTCVVLGIVEDWDGKGGGGCVVDLGI